MTWLSVLVAIVLAVPLSYLISVLVTVVFVIVSVTCVNLCDLFFDLFFYLRGRFRVWYWLKYERPRLHVRLAQGSEFPPVQVLIRPENEWIK